MANVFGRKWDDYGGIKAYTNAFGSDHQGWYTNTAAQAQYQRYVAAIVNRYKSDPTIFAWELSNEVRCNGCNVSVIYDWAVKNSAYVKSLDPNHMVTLGDEGFGVAGGDGSYPYGYSEGVDFNKNLAIKNLDFGTFHLYPVSDFRNSYFGVPFGRSKYISERSTQSGLGDESYSRG